jgi:hypothetical protein
MCHTVFRFYEAHTILQYKLLHIIHAPIAIMTITQIMPMVNEPLIMAMNTGTDLFHPSISHTIAKHQATSAMMITKKPTISEWPSIA